jgi:hypothetical protein
VGEDPDVMDLIARARAMHSAVLGDADVDGLIDARNETM